MTFDWVLAHDPETVVSLIGLLVPVVVAIVSKRVASAGLKGVLNLLLSAVAGSVAYLVTEMGTYDLAGFLGATLNTFIVSIVSYYGLYKPTGITDNVNSATANFGFGGPDLQADTALEPVEMAVDASAHPHGEADIETIHVSKLPVTLIIEAPVRASRKRAKRRKAIKLKPKYRPQHSAGSPIAEDVVASDLKDEGR